MAVVVPHLAFPPRPSGNRHFAVVEQDSEDDILSCVYIALKTPIGSRPYVPNFGVEDYTFTSPVPVSQLQAQIQESEPRVDVSLTVKVDELIETVTVVEGGGRA